MPRFSGPFVRGRGVGRDALDTLMRACAHLGFGFKRPRAGPASAPMRTDQAPSRSSRLAFSFRISGFTLSLKPASSKSFIQRSGVING